MTLRQAFMTLWRYLWGLELEGEAGLGHFLSLMSDPQQDWEAAMKHVALAL